MRKTISLGAAAALAVAMMLSGCWSSAPPLFQPSEAVTGVIPNGLYSMNTGAEGADVMPPGESFFVETRRDRSLRVTARYSEAKQDTRVLVIPQAALAPKRYLLQIESRAHLGAHKALYAMLDARVAPLRVVILPCGEAAAAAAQSGGGSIARDPNAASSCVFKDRASLLAALQRIAAEKPDDGEAIALVPQPLR